MSSSCKCLVELRKSLVADTGDAKLQLDTKLYCKRESAIEVLKPAAMRVTYRRKKKDGAFCKRAVTTFVTYHYCPFCGEKYPG